MNDLVKLQKRGFYLSLSLFPDGHYWMTIARLDENWTIHGTAKGPLEAVQWFMEMAREYEEGT